MHVMCYLNFILNVEHVACIQCFAFYGQHLRNSEVEVILFIKHIYKFQLVGLVKCIMNHFQDFFLNVIDIVFGLAFIVSQYYHLV